MVLAGTITVRSRDRISESPSQHKYSYWRREQRLLPAEEMRGWPACPAGPLEILLGPEQHS